MIHDALKSMGVGLLGGFFSKNFTAWEDDKKVIAAPRAPRVLDIRCDFAVLMDVSLTSHTKFPQRHTERQSFCV